MKTLLLITLAAAFNLISYNLAFCQGEMITTKTFKITRDGRQEEIRSYITKFDSIINIDDEKIHYIAEDEKHYIDLDYHTLIDITIKNDEKKQRFEKKEVMSQIG